MNEYMIVTTDVTQLKKQLAQNVIGSAEAKIVAVNASSGRQTIWFTTHEATREGFTEGEVFHGLASLTAHCPTHKKVIARIESEGSALILITDL